MLLKIEDNSKLYRKFLWKFEKKPKIKNRDDHKTVEIELNINRQY